jgi:hypothetical protein
MSQEYYVIDIFYIIRFKFSFQLIINANGILFSQMLKSVSESKALAASGP